MTKSKLLSKKAAAPGELPGYGQTDESTLLTQLAKKHGAEILSWDAEGDFDEMVDMNADAKLAISSNENGAEAAIVILGMADGKKILFPLSAYYNLNLDSLLPKMQALQDEINENNLGV